MAKQQPLDLKVFITTSEVACSECGEDLGRSAWITLVHSEVERVLARWSENL